MEIPLPAQETAVGVGDTVYFTKTDEPSPATETSASVVEFDLGARSVVLRMSQATGDRRPTAVFSKQYLDKRPLEHALLRLAEHFRDQGFSTDGPFAAASDLLLRRQPRRSAACGTSLQGPEESVLAALKRVCAELERRHPAGPGTSRRWEDLQRRESDSRIDAGWKDGRHQRMRSQGHRQFAYRQLEMQRGRAL